MKAVEFTGDLTSFAIELSRELKSKKGVYELVEIRSDSQQMHLFLFALLGKLKKMLIEMGVIQRNINDDVFRKDIFKELGFYDNVVLPHASKKMYLTKKDFKKEAWSVRLFSFERYKQVITSVRELVIETGIKCGYFKGLGNGNKFEREFLRFCQNNMCPICGLSLNHGTLERHHAFVHDTIVNNERFPNLTQSALNLFLCHNSCHMGHGNWGILSGSGFILALENDVKEAGLGKFENTRRLWESIDRIIEVKKENLYHGGWEIGRKTKIKEKK